VAGLASLASLGVLVVVVVGGFVQRDDARDDFVDHVDLTGVGGDRFTMELTAWFWVALVGSVLALAAAVAAVRLAPWWPEMGSRYDAPAPGGAAPTSTAPAEERSNAELWKSLDEGEDPTA